MKALTIIQSRFVPINIENIDTDQIIPARFLKATTKDGFGKNLFRDWRYENDDESTPRAEFPLNQSQYSGEILVAGKNFGCGSSREHAAWSILDYGFWKNKPSRSFPPATALPLTSTVIKKPVC